MPDFQMFRVHVDLSLFNGDVRPEEMLRRCLEARPSAELRRNTYWHIGNLIAMDESAYYFRIGRTSRQTVEVYQDGNFVDQELDTSPYTHAIADVELEIVAIARRTSLSKTTTIAGYVAKLLAQSDPANEAHFDIREVKDPDDLITYLQRSQAVRRFRVWFGRPNPIDVNRDFLDPFQRFVRETQAESGTTEIKGETLDAQVLEDLVRSAAATGDDASATMETEEGGLVTKRLVGNPVVIAAEGVDDAAERRTLLQRIRETYRRIRGQGGGAL